jgi:predicted nucleic acid-binding protein
MIVSNSTVLIFLSKIDKLYLLKELFKTIFIPEEVKNEVVNEGKKQNHIDAIEIEKAVNDGWINIEKTDIIPILENIGIDKGEAEAISLAHKKDLDLLLDQDHARRAASLLEIKARGTIYVLLLALKKKLISYDAYLLCLLDLTDIGFRMSEEVYIEAIRLGKEFSGK